MIIFESTTWIGCELENPEWGRREVGNCNDRVMNDRVCIGNPLWFPLFLSPLGSFRVGRQMGRGQQLVELLPSCHVWKQKISLPPPQI